MKNRPEPGTPRAYVVDCLESYATRSRKISVLRYELEHCAHITPEEMIDVMNYSRSNNIDRTKIRTSNNSCSIALNYKEAAQRINNEVVEEISNQLTELEQVQSRLDYYISLLDERGQNVLRMHYLEGSTLAAIAQKLFLTERTIERSKKRAIEELAEMYELAYTGIPE